MEKQRAHPFVKTVFKRKKKRRWGRGKRERERERGRERGREREKHLKNRGRIQRAKESARSPGKG